MNLLERVAKGAGRTLLTGLGHWCNSFMGQPAGIHGSLVAPSERGKGLTREELQHGPAMEHTAGVPNRCCCSLAAPLFRHVLPLAAIARKKPIVGQMVPESCLRATLTVVIPDDSCGPGG